MGAPPRAAEAAAQADRRAEAAAPRAAEAAAPRAAEKFLDHRAAEAAAAAPPLSMTTTCSN